MHSGTSAGAVIHMSALRELWIHTGTACNLSCPFCHEGSAPADSRLGALTLAEVRPQLEAAAAAGVHRFAFTGGEPLILREIVPILDFALGLRPCLVLTNGTAPLVRRPHHLAQLRARPHPLTLRVSIDYPDEVRHDAGRGLRNFRKALQGLKLLSDAGFQVGVTRQRDPGEDPHEVSRQFRQLLRRHGLAEDLPIVPLPELGRPGVAKLDEVGPLAAQKRASPACLVSRMLVKRDGKLRYSACPLIDDQPERDLPANLAQACAAPVQMNHARCHLCLAGAVDYGGWTQAGIKE